MARMGFDRSCSWVFSTETKSAATGSGTRQIWKPELSTTAAKLNDSSWSIIYGKSLFPDMGCMPLDMYHMSLGNNPWLTPSQAMAATPPAMSGRTTSTSAASLSPTPSSRRR